MRPLVLQPVSPIPNATVRLSLHPSHSATERGRRENKVRHSEIVQKARMVLLTFCYTVFRRDKPLEALISDRLGALLGAAFVIGITECHHARHFCCRSCEFVNGLLRVGLWKRCRSKECEPSVTRSREVWKRTYR